MKLVNPTNEQLNAAFAEKVVGWVWIPLAEGAPYWEGNYWMDREGVMHDPKASDCLFTTSADAVLPWLEKTDDPDAAYRDGLWSVAFYVDKENNWVKGEDKSLPRAAAIALLRAHGVEVEYAT